MDIRSKIGVQLLLLSLIILVWIGVFLFIGRKEDNVDYWGAMMMGVSTITFFGFLLLPGNVNEKGVFNESRIRLSITATLIVTYIIFFGAVAFLNNKDEFVSPDLISTLTNMISVTIPFYFGASAAVEIVKLQKKKSEEESKDSSAGASGNNIEASDFSESNK